MPLNKAQLGELDYEGDSENEGEDPLPTPMHTAVDSKNYASFHALVACGVSVNGNGIYEPKLSNAIASPLCMAVMQDNLDGVKVLLGCGADPNVAKICNNSRPLKMAVSSQVIELLLVQGAEVNARESVNWTNLHFTPVRGDVEMARMLVANEGNPRAKDSDAKTIPAYAAMVGGEEQEFLIRAYKGFSRLYDHARGLPYRRSETVTESDIDELQRELAPYVITSEKRRAIKQELYECSALFFHIGGGAGLYDARASTFTFEEELMDGTWEFEEGNEGQEVEEGEEEDEDEMEGDY